MAYHFENVKLEKGMYGRSGHTFSQTLEELDPSEHYRGTALEGLDAFQRQLKRFDIKVKGAGSDMVEKFFHTSESAVLFPEFVSRVVRQGMEEESILSDITATVTRFDGMDYRSIASVPTEADKKLLRVEEGAVIPQTTVRTQENLVRLHKRGRMLVASYEAIRFQRLDLFSVTLRQIGAYIGRMHLEDAIKVLCDGDGNDNAADSFKVGTSPISGTSGTLSYDALLDFWSQFDPYTMNTLLVSNDMMLQQALRTAMETASAQRRERIAVVGGDGDTAAELVERAARLNSERMVLVGPDALDSNGNTLAGVFAAAAVAGILADGGDPAVPLNGAELSGLGGLDQDYGDNEVDLLVRGGVTPLESVAGVISPVRGITTRTTTGGAADTTWRELTTILIVDDIIPTMRSALRSRFSRAKNTARSRGAIRSQVIVELEKKVAAEIIDSYGEVRVTASEEDPTVCLVEFSFAVAHGLNQIYLTVHITV